MHRPARIKGFVIFSRLCPNYPYTYLTTTPKRPSCSRNCAFIIVLSKSSSLAARASKRPRVSVQATLQPRHSIPACYFPFAQTSSSSSPEPTACIHQYSLLSGLALLPPFRLLTLLRKPPPPPLGSTGPPPAPSLVILLSSNPPVGTRLGLLRALALALI